MKYIALFLLLTSAVVSAEPATEETISQLNEFVVIFCLIVSFGLGAIFGHMR